MRPHRVHWQTPGFQSASLDHAMWFHKPINFNDWHLYAKIRPARPVGEASSAARSSPRTGRWWRAWRRKG